VKWIGGVILVIITIAMWNMPSHKSRGSTVGDRVVAKGMAYGLLMIPLMALGYLLNRRKSADAGSGEGDQLPTNKKD
jgi:hypothetical protein